MYVAIVFLPLAAALIAGFFGRWIGDRGAQLVTCGAVSASAVMSVIAFVSVGLNHETAQIVLFTWIASGDFVVTWGLRIDTLTAVMLVVVNVVSALVHIYSIGYMSKDAHKARFMSYLSLFTFAMLMLVTADNLVQMYFGWEGVGLASYLLIGFWSDRPAANAAAIKAFVVNRVGDFGFALGIMALFMVTGSVSLDVIFAASPGLVGETFHFLAWDVDILTTICILLFIGAMGKSAQLGLHTWLPDAMEGPTPVSALIHAATMVTAGVFMVARLSPIFEFSADALLFVAVIGASTAFFAATIALVQNDIKRVIAYSTCSQLGYMFFAIGISAYEVAIFHLFTHAFFKALLFLGAGSVIHAVSDEQDMRRMGGLGKHIKATTALMWIGSISLAGLPPLAGYYSKDLIIEAAFMSHSPAAMFAFAMGIAAAFMTAFYSWRLLYMTFHGETRASAEVMAHVHESPPVMILPLVGLAIGAILAGLLFADYFVGEGRLAFWNGSIFVSELNAALLDEAHHAPLWVKASTLAVVILGIGMASVFYLWKTQIPKTLAETMPDVHRFLLNKWYFDELYDFLFVRPAKAIGYSLWKKGDGRIIDGFGPDGVAAAVLRTTARVVKIQSGYLYHYAFAMLIGLAGFVTWYIYALGGN